MEHTPVTASEFERRLIALLTSGGGPGLPRRPRDRHILFRCAIRNLDANRAYPEAAVNEHLERWLETEGSTLEVDRVSLRRELVDAGYLERDPAGHHYRLQRDGNGAVPFLPEVDAVDPIHVLRTARERAETRRHRALSS